MNDMDDSADVLGMYDIVLVLLFTTLLGIAGPAIWDVVTGDCSLCAVLEMVGWR